MVEKMTKEQEDDVAIGARCRCCGLFMDDTLLGEEDPGFERTCEVCLEAKEAA